MVILTGFKFRQFLGFIVNIVSWLVIFFMPVNHNNLVLLMVLGLVNTFVFLRKMLNFQPGLILAIFISFYLLYLIPVFFYDVPIASHYMYNTPANYKVTLAIMVFFFIFLNFFIKKSNIAVVINKNLPVIKSWPLFVLFVLLQLVIIVQALRTGVAIGGNASYDAYVANLENSNGLWEYYFIVYFLAYLFSPKKICHAVLIFLFFVYIYISITRGFRIQMIEMSLLFFLLYLDGKFNNLLIVFISVFGLIAMEIYGIWKLIGVLDWGRIIENYEIYDKIMVSNQTEVFYSTTGFIYKFNTGILDFGLRVETFAAFIINFIVPSGLLWNGSRILDHMYNSDIGGGGFCFGYFYIWMGYSGVILLSYFIGWNLNNRFSKNPYKIMFLVMFIALTPRWFAYEPTNHLIRLPLTLLIGYGLIMLAFKNRLTA